MREALIGWWRSPRAAEGLWACARTVTSAAWTVGRGLTVLLFITALANGLFPIVQIFCVSTVVGRLPELAEDGSSTPDGLYVALGVVAATYFASQISPVVQWSLGRALGIRVDALVRREAMAGTLDPPGLEPLDRAPLRDAVTLAREVRSAAFGADAAIHGVANLVAGRLQGIVAAAVLAAFRWWAPVILLVTFLPWDAYFRAEHHKITNSWLERTPEQDRAVYFWRLGTDAAAGKEVRLFGLSDFVRGRYAAHFLEGMKPVWRQRTTSLRRFLPPVLIVVAGYLVVFGALGWELATARQSLTSTTLFLLMAGQVWRVTPSFNDLTRLGIGAAPLLSARRARADAAGAAATVKGSAPPVGVARAEAAPRNEIRFEGVRFAYPGAPEILRGLDLTIPVGRSLAIVGDNGAGKTTLVKLLCGLYQPTAGRITVDGTDLRELDPFRWREHLAVLFQDYVHYPLSLRENVTVGAGGANGDEHVARALADADATGLAERLPDGVDTVLGRDFPGGVELSGGQWQKVAVARTMAGLRDTARVLVLDEPTANLDVRSEASLFERILRVAHGQTTLLISHRFANVRHAHSIVVLRDGIVAEQGSHAELICEGGAYATAFRLQAARFQRPPDEDDPPAGGTDR